jgi:predicted O-methyltransferase YrrM
VIVAVGATLRRMLPSPAWRALRALGTAVYTPLRFSVSTGHWRSSLAARAQSENGTPLPWYTYPAIDFLNPRDFSGRRILEFGGGQSTLWWSQRAAQVVTIEEDLDWYRHLAQAPPANVQLRHVEADTTTRSTTEVLAVIERASGGAPFDVIVVDGHLRREVFAASFSLLATGGAIIFDNADGYGFYDEVKGRRCARVDFFGFAPGVSARHCTSLVFVGDCFLLAADAPLPRPEAR